MAEERKELGVLSITTSSDGGSDWHSAQPDNWEPPEMEATGWHGVEERAMTAVLPSMLLWLILPVMGAFFGPVGAAVGFGLGYSTTCGLLYIGWRAHHEPEWRRVE